MLRRLSAPLAVLLGLILCGVALRVVAIASTWPANITLEDGYEVYSGYNPFADPQHPAGYPLILAAIGAFSRNIALTVLVQHLAGLCAALLLWAATGRVTRSRWAGLLPAAVVLLNPDEIFVEHAVMSESWALLFTAAGLYAAVRVFDDSCALVALAAAHGRGHGACGNHSLVRAAGDRGGAPRPDPDPATAAPDPARAVARTHSGGGSGRDSAAGLRAGQRRLGTPLRARALTRLVPLRPRGAVRRLQPVHPARGNPRPVPDPPAVQPAGLDVLPVRSRVARVRLFGGIGKNDAVVGSWARRAARAQPDDFASTAWDYLWGYFVPSSIRPELGVKLDPQLDFTYDNAFFAEAQHQRMETFYAPFDVHTRRDGLEVLHDLQNGIRFGGTALSITTLLTLLGLLIGTRRSRVGVLLFGVGGLSMILAPALTGAYVGRYTVPLAGPLTAAAAVTLTELWRALAVRRRRGRRPALAAGVS